MSEGVCEHAGHECVGEPEHEWRIVRSDGTLLQHAADEADAARRASWFMDAHAERRVKASAWERV